MASCQEGQRDVAGKAEDMLASQGVSWSPSGSPETPAGSWCCDPVVCVQVLQKLGPSLPELNTHIPASQGLKPRAKPGAGLPLPDTKEVSWPIHFNVWGLQKGLLFHFCLPNLAQNLSWGPPTEGKF